MHECNVVVRLGRLINFLLKNSMMYFKKGTKVIKIINQAKLFLKLHCLYTFLARQLFVKFVHNL